MHKVNASPSPSRARPWRVAVIDHFRNKARGGHGLHEAFIGLPGVTICAVADPDEPSRRSLLADTGAAAMYEDWRELLDREKPDVVCICSRLPVQHPEVVVAAAEAGCHIYCEKPFATDLCQADRMIAAADAAGVKLAVAHLARYWESFHTARRMIRDGEIGRPLLAYCRGKEDDRGGGEDMMVLGTHLFDSARFLLGDPNWVFGHVSRDRRDITRADASEPTEPVGTVAGDEIVAMFGFPENVHCHFESRRGMFDGKQWRFGMTVVGTRATLAFRYGEGDRVLRISRSTQPFEEGGDFVLADETPLPAIAGAAPLKPEETGSGIWAYYKRCNRRAAWDLLCAATENREPVCSGRDARWTLEMVHGVYASHLAGKKLALPLSERRHPLQ
ncbi:MAG TPA: Gfo/Idh/MocA family oxidoreductase [Phycisphaerae bacterium]|nr:Gfo/Idh/MocA family oxidoreductase [Phycisphaerae bacterium]HOI55863.1 Gfo/Idh/MocA family oxidoreductase [Phycisphaerae bacterium]